MDSRIWDPHPQYIIEAFGQKMRLDLYNDGSFIHKDMKVGSWAVGGRPPRAWVTFKCDTVNERLAAFPVSAINQRAISLTFTGHTQLGQRDAAPQDRPRRS